MTQYLPPNLLALFAPREPIPFKPPAEKLSHDKKRAPYTGIAQYLQKFEDPEETPPPFKAETRDEKRERKKREKAELQAYKIEQGIALWNPAEDPHATSDPYRTLFVGRINYETSESKLRREFEAYGPVKRVVMAHDKKTGKPRGYAFIEFERERDMHTAYKHADGRKIDGRRVLVDVERGRTVKGWLPRRLGGGLGNTRRAKEPLGDGMVDDSRGDSRSRDSRRDDRSDRRKSRSKERSDRGNSRSDRDRKRRSRSRSKDRGGNRGEKRYKPEERRRSRDREVVSRDRRRSRERDTRRDRDTKRDPDFEPKTEVADSPEYQNNDENGDYQ